MILGKKYNIIGKVRIISDDGTVPSCNPNSVLDNDSCPRANIRAFKHGKRISQKINIGHVVVPFKAGNWNILYGSFVVDHEIEAADKVVFFVDGVKEGIEIALDDIKIVPSTDGNNKNCIRNGDFEVGDSRNCKAYYTTCVCLNLNFYYNCSKFFTIQGNA